MIYIHTDIWILDGLLKAFFLKIIDKKNPIIQLFLKKEFFLSTDKGKLF